MTLDLYAYGRSLPNEGPALSAAEAELQTFVCAGCGCSAAAPDAALVLTIGWRLLPIRTRGGDRPALCARCARRFVSSLV